MIGAACRADQDATKALCPVFIADPASMPAGLAEELGTLRRAIEERDAGTVEAMMLPDIRLGFGNTQGLNHLRLGDPHALVWRYLERATAFGCRPAGGSPEAIWECPGVTAPEPESIEIDPFAQVFTVYSGSVLRGKPAAESEIVAVLNCGVHSFDLAGWDSMSQAARDSGDWIPVVLRDGRRGYLTSQAAYRPTGHRLLLQPDGKQWRISAFVAGD